MIRATIMSLKVVEVLMRWLSAVEWFYESNLEWFYESRVQSKGCFDSRRPVKSWFDWFCMQNRRFLYLRDWDVRMMTSVKKTIEKQSYRIKNVSAEIQCMQCFDDEQNDASCSLRVALQLSLISAIQSQLTWWRKRLIFNRLNSDI